MANAVVKHSTSNIMMDTVAKHQVHLLNLCNDDEYYRKEVDDAFSRVNAISMSELGTIGMETMSKYANYVATKMMDEPEYIRNEYIVHSKENLASNPAISLNMMNVANIALICQITNDVKCWNDSVAKVRHNRTMQLH